MALEVIKGGKFQSPFGELKIGKNREAIKRKNISIVSVPFRGIKNRKVRKAIATPTKKQRCFSPLSGN